MTAVLIGEFTLGEAIPGLSEWFNTTGVGLQGLASSVSNQLGVISSIADDIDGLADDLNDAVDNIIAGPLGTVKDAASVAQSALDALRLITDASAYLSGIIQSLNDVATDLALLDPTQYLTDVINSTSAAVSSLEQAATNFSGYLSDITSVQNEFGIVSAALRGVESALQSALDAANSAIEVFLLGLDQLAHSGIYVVHYNGQLSSLGGEVGAVLPGTGIPGTEFVVGPLLIARTLDPASAAAIRAVFDITI